MPIRRDTSSISRSRSRTRSHSRQASARARNANGVLVLYAEGAEPTPRPAPKDSMSEDSILASLRAERDAALEEAAYLREQLRSLSAYHIHLLDEERRRMFDERTQLATELVTLREELHRRAYPGGKVAWNAGGSSAAASDGHVTGTT
jgi:hypothetical protein